MSRFAAPTPALPVDLFRALVGLLSSAYFLHLLLQARDFAGPGGLIDHALSLELFWYTRIGLFQPGMGLLFFQAAFLLAALASWALALGYRPKVAAAFLFVVAVSTYRWNYLVIYVDDAIMHLVLFWMLLLPIGRTLVLREWLRDGRGAVERWKRELVPGTAVRCFLANLALIYLVAHKRYRSCSTPSEASIRNTGSSEASVGSSLLESRSSSAAPARGSKNTSVPSYTACRTLSWPSSSSIRTNPAKRNIRPRAILPQ